MSEDRDTFTRRMRETHFLTDAQIEDLWHDTQEEE